MSATAKTLDYYLKNPDEMPEDPKEIERLTQEHMQHASESGGEQLTVDRFVPPDETKGESSKPAEVKPAEPKAAPEEVAAPAVEEAAPAEETPAGILAKDGKNVIPYSQLESARQRASAAEALVKAQAEELERLKVAKPVADVEMLTDQELEVLEADSPTLAKTLRAQQGMIQSLSSTVEELKQRSETQAEQQEAEVKGDIQSAIDGNPTLAAWQTAEDQTMWNEAARFDQLLRESPKYANISFEDRFAKVVELTQTALDLQPEAHETPAEQMAPKPEEVKAAAKAVLDTKSKKATPKTLTDIPGGAPPEVDEKAKVENMSIVGLGNQFLGMTKEQMETYLATL